MEKKEEKKIPRRPSKRDRMINLLAALDRWVAEGKTQEEAVGMLTVKQYDFLIDNDVDLDAMLLNSKQLLALRELRRTPRPVFPDGYNKKYPEVKKTVFDSLVQFLKTISEEVILPEKVNYRDVDFVSHGTKFHLVMSMPRKKD